MKTLEYVKEHIDEIEKDTFLDRRFTKRFLDFLPWEEWEKFNFSPSDYFNKEAYVPKEWTEENVLDQLKSDVKFAIEKAEYHRGISAELMYYVIQAWCSILENGLEDTPYGWYGDKLIKAVDELYGFGLTKGHFNDDFYSDEY